MKTYTFEKAMDTAEQEAANLTSEVFQGRARKTADEALTMLDEARSKLLMALDMDKQDRKAFLES